MNVVTIGEFQRVTWSDASGFELALFIAGAIITIGLFCFFIWVFHRKEQQ